MNIFQISLAIFCVLAISAGQLLFKAAGNLLHETENWFYPKVVLIIGAAGILYCFATLLWIHLLKSTELNKAYVFMAISFVIVPLASNYIYQEQLSVWYFFGLTLIVTGLIVVIRFG